MSVRLRFSPREMASLRIGLAGRIQRLRTYIKETEAGDLTHQQDLLAHLVKLHNRLHKATYGKDYIDG